MTVSALPAAQRRFAAHWGWHLLGAALVGGCLAVLTTMFWPQGLALDALELDYGQLDGSLTLGETWMGAYQNDRKLGYVHGSVRRVSDGLSLSQRSHFLVSLAGLKQAVDSTLEILLDEGYAMRRFAFELHAGPVRLTADGILTERGLEVDVDVGGERAHRVLPLAEAPLFDLALPFLLARKRLEPGDRFLVRVFDPQTLANREQVVEVVGPEAVSVDGRLRPATHLIRKVGGLDSHSWIDANGKLLKQEVENGLVLLREDADQAQRGVEGMSPDGAQADWLRGLLGRPNWNGKVEP